MSDLTVKELKEKKEEMEIEMLKYLRTRVFTFVRDTEIKVASISIDMEELWLVSLQNPVTTVSNVTVKINI